MAKPRKSKGSVRGAKRPVGIVPPAATPQGGPGPTAIEIDELLSIIGQKDVELFLIRRQVGAMQQALTAAQARIAELEGTKPNAEKAPAEEGAEG